AGRRIADDGERRALGEGRHDRGGAEPDAYSDAAGNDRLLGLAAALRVEDVERDAALLEEAGALSELGRRRLPVAAGADRELDRMVGKGGAWGQRKRERESECFHCSKLSLRAEGSNLLWCRRLLRRTRDDATCSAAPARGRPSRRRRRDSSPGRQAW